MKQIRRPEGMSHNSHKIGGMVLIIAMMMPILLVSCGKTEKGSQAVAQKASMPDEQYYGYLKTKFDASSDPQEEAQLMQSYLSAYPKGEHMGEATALLEEAKQKNKQYMASACSANLRQIEGAKEQWAMQANKSQGDPFDVRAAANYIAGGVFPACPAGGTYTYGAVGTDVCCSISGHRL
jgi:hypothetical protein